MQSPGESHDTRLKMFPWLPGLGLGTTVGANESAEAVPVRIAVTVAAIRSGAQNATIRRFSTTSAAPVVPSRAPFRLFTASTPPKLILVDRPLLCVTSA
jgi:hypothetical protein